MFKDIITFFILFNAKLKNETKTIPFISLVIL
jgi:hypothetical protein